MNVQTTPSLDRHIVIRTPEHLEIKYELAGAGTRSAAYLCDLMVLYIALTVLGNLLAQFAIMLFVHAEAWVGAIVGLVSFATVTSYFFLFELLWSGQTPGKRLVGIRVVKSGGYALRPVDSLLRNLMRAVDFLPVCYGIGLVSLLLTSRSQRLGDLVAGTLVVYHRPDGADRDTLPVRKPEQMSLPLVQLSAVPDEVISVCDEYLRMSEQLAPRYRQELAESITRLIESTSGLRPDARQSLESFLTAVIDQAGQIPRAT
jgi:uncharacterized RDD family membrane protein YckC